MPKRSVGSNSDSRKYDMKDLTIIVPTYNMEALLPRCLDSVTHPSVPDTLEVLVVIDGSTDRSAEIARSYHQRRADIVRVIEKENGQYGSCFNVALSEAMGRYVRLLDADDWFDTVALVSMLEQLVHCDADMVHTHFTRYYADCEEVIAVAGVEFGRCNQRSEFHGLPMLHLFMHSLTYRTELLREIGLRLDEGISFTDTQFTLLPVPHIQSLICFDLNLYQYDMNRDGQSIKQSVSPHFIEQLYHVGDHILGHFEVLRKEMMSTWPPFYDRLLVFPFWTLFTRVALYCPYDAHCHEQAVAIDRRLKAFHPRLYYSLYPLYRGETLGVCLWRLFGRNYFRLHLDAVSRAYARFYTIIRKKIS